MAPESPALYMLRLRLDQQRLVAFGRRRGLPVRDADLGYLVHCQLGELFGDRAPGPFTVVEARGRHVTLLAYSDAPKGELRARADAFADPAVHAACDFEGLEEKRMPTAWPPGRRLGFEARVCPIVRTGSEGANHRKGAEVDAFLARCRAAGPGTPVDRELVYHDWLAREVERNGATRLLAAALTAFRLERVVRRRAGPERASRVFQRPAAVLRGELEVTDEAAFAALLRRGVGRHRAFGFGMVLLRPPGTLPC